MLRWMTKANEKKRKIYFKWNEKINEKHAYTCICGDNIGECIVYFACVVDSKRKWK